MGRRGGRNTSARPLPQASAYNVPAFASGLGMTLEPIKAAVAASSSTSTAVASTAAAALPVDGHGVGPAATTPNATATLEKVSEREIFLEGSSKNFVDKREWGCQVYNSMLLLFQHCCLYVH